MLSVTGFGHDGPEGGRAGYDQIAQGEAGLMSLTGSGPDDPQRVGVPIADLLAGMYGAYGVLAALHERDRTGVGTIVRTSLLAATVGVHAFQGTRWTVAGEVGQAQGNHHPSISAVRAVPLPQRVGADRGRERRTVATPVRGLRHRPAHSGPGHELRAGGQPRTGHRGDRAGVRGVGGRASPGATGGGRHPRRQGADDRRGLRLGPDRQPGSPGRRRALGARTADAARTAAALLRGRRDRGDPQGSTLAPPTLDQHGRTVRAWLQRRRPDTDGDR